MIPYPRYTKLIINHILTTYPKIPKRITKPRHDINDDDVVGYMILSVTTKAMAIRILDELLMEEIRQTEAYKLYDYAFKGVAVPMTQPLLVVSTQGTPRTFNAPRSPKLKQTSKKKGEQVLCSCNTQESEERESVELVKESVLEQEVDKMVEGDEGDLGFLDELIVEPDTRKRTSSLESRVQKKQTPITTPSKSIKTDLSSNKVPQPVSLPGIYGKGMAMPQFIKKDSRDGSSTEKESIGDKLGDADEYVNLDQSSDYAKVLQTDGVLDSQNMLKPEAPLTSLIKEFLRNFMQNHAITLQPSSHIPISELHQQLYSELKGSPKSQAADLEIWAVLKA
ncbi:hypothetical protein Tco_0649930 [Tanacetum coccineum]